MDKNKKRLIDANKLWVAFDEAGLFDDGNPRHIAQQTVEEQPIVDAMEVAHGRWKHMFERGIRYRYCSKCNHKNGVGIDFNYCPNCGAKMDGDADG